MTYDAFEYSIQDGDPLLRFVFSTGGTDYAYTTEDNIVSDSNYTFTPAPIAMSKVRQTNELAKDPLKIMVPRDHELAALFLGAVPETITTVSVFRLHRSDTSEGFEFYWKGRVAGVAGEGDRVELNCENIFSAMRRTGLRARYQRKCRHALYQRGCNINDYDYAQIVEVTAASGYSVTVPEIADSNDDGYYTGGMIETADGTLRYIIRQDGSTLTLIQPHQSLIESLQGSVGTLTVTLYPGCDHTRNTCKTKFNNLDNFGGFPWIPSRNPFGNDVNGSIV